MLETPVASLYAHIPLSNTSDLFFALHKSLFFSYPSGTRMLAFILAPLLLFHTHVSGETTLYIPGADEQPMSVQQLGTDGNGRTSWLIHPGTPTGTFTDPSVQFTATLVEGPSDAVLQGSLPGGPAFSYSCAIAGSQANCQLVASDQSLTETTSIIETVSPFVVQGGGSPSSDLSSRLPSLTLTSLPPTGTSSPLSMSPTIPASGLPPQPGVTPKNSAHANRNNHIPWA